jgi:hypothetical protein
MKGSPHRLRPCVAGALWVIAVGSGMAVLWRYSTAPGLPAAPPRAWPRESRIEPRTDRATLIVLAHPQCPCTSATIEELDRLMARVGDRLRAHVLFATPVGAASGWEATDLWRRAAAIPGVTVLRDAEGIEAHRFHAATSGQVILYDADGRLRFNGGITAARGHAGDNPGRSAIVEMLVGNPSVASETPVFGCSLLGAEGS